MVNEWQYLISFYKNIKQKRGRVLTKQLNRLNEGILGSFVQTYIRLKKAEYLIESNRWRIHETEVKLKAHKMNEITRKNVVNQIDRRELLVCKVAKLDFINKMLVVEKVQK